MLNVGIQFGFTSVTPALLLLVAPEIKLTPTKARPKLLLRGTPPTPLLRLVRIRLARLAYLPNNPPTEVKALGIRPSAVGKKRLEI